jgi:hypothetical protein
MYCTPPARLLNHSGQDTTALEIPQCHSSSYIRCIVTTRPHLLGDLEIQFRHSRGRSYVIDGSDYDNVVFINVYFIPLSSYAVGLELFVVGGIS